MLLPVTVTLRRSAEGRASKGDGPMRCHLLACCTTSADHPSRLASLAPQDDGFGSV